MGNMGVFRVLGFNPANPGHILAASFLACMTLGCVTAFVGAVGRGVSTAWGGERLRLAIWVPGLLGMLALAAALLGQAEPHLGARVSFTLAASLGATGGLWAGWVTGPDKTPSVPALNPFTEDEPGFEGAPPDPNMIFGEANQEEAANPVAVSRASGSQPRQSPGAD